MELLQLQYFFDTSKNESFAKTAEKYLVPSSSVSASVRRLEEELECKLFDRYANRIKLNENGRLLQSYLCIVFDELGQARLRLSHQKNENAQISLLVRSLRHDVTNAIVRYRALHPEVIFRTSFSTEEQELDRYSIVIDEQKDDYAGMKCRRLCTLQIGIKAFPDHPLLGRVLTLSQLRHQSFVTMGEETNLHQILLRACKRAGFTPHVVMETNDISCYATCIREGMGIGLSRIRRNGTDQKIFLHVTDFEEMQTVCAYYKPSECHAYVADFLDFLSRWDF